MKNMIKSLVIIIVFTFVAGGAVLIYFSSAAPATSNTFSTGTQEVHLQNSSHFVEASALPAKYLDISAADVEEPELYSDLVLKDETNCGWPALMVADGTGVITGLSKADLLSQNWTELAAGNVETGDHSALQEKTHRLNLGVENRTNQVRFIFV